MIDATHIDFAVFAAAPVAGWPANVRRLVRAGGCALHDLDLQQFAPGETSFVTDTRGDPNLHAVSIAPYPRLVDKPEGGT